MASVFEGGARASKTALKSLERNMQETLNGQSKTMNALKEHVEALEEDLGRLGPKVKRLECENVTNDQDKQVIARRLNGVVKALSIFRGLQELDGDPLPHVADIRCGIYLMSATNTPFYNTNTGNNEEIVYGHDGRLHITGDVVLHGDLILASPEAKLYARGASLPQSELIVSPPPPAVGPAEALANVDNAQDIVEALDGLRQVTSDIETLRADMKKLKELTGENSHTPQVFAVFRDDLQKASGLLERLEHLEERNERRAERVTQLETDLEEFRNKFNQEIGQLSCLDRRQVNQVNEKFAHLIKEAARLEKKIENPGESEQKDAPPWEIVHPPEGREGELLTYKANTKLWLQDVYLEADVPGELGNYESLSSILKNILGETSRINNAVCEMKDHLPSFTSNRIKDFEKGYQSNSSIFLHQLRLQSGVYDKRAGSPRLNDVIQDLDRRIDEAKELAAEELAPTGPTWHAHFLENELRQFVTNDEISAHAVWVKHPRSETRLDVGKKILELTKRLNAMEEQGRDSGKLPEYRPHWIRLPRCGGVRDFKTEDQLTVNDIWVPSDNISSHVSLKSMVFNLRKDVLGLEKRLTEFGAQGKSDATAPSQSAPSHNAEELEASVKSLEQHLLNEVKRIGENHFDIRFLRRESEKDINRLFQLVGDLDKKLTDFMGEFTEEDDVEEVEETSPDNQERMSQAELAIKDLQMQNLNMRALLDMVLREVDVSDIMRFINQEPEENGVREYVEGPPGLLSFANLPSNYQPVQNYPGGTPVEHPADEFNTAPPESEEEQTQDQKPHTTSKAAYTAPTILSSPFVPPDMSLADLLRQSPLNNVESEPTPPQPKGKTKEAHQKRKRKNKKAKRSREMQVFIMTSTFWALVAILFFHMCN